MSTILIHHADCIVTMDASRREINDGAILIRDHVIEWIGSAEELPLEALSADYGINARGRIVLPGFVNTHHHFFQTLTRVIPGAQNAVLFDWLKTLYPIWGENTAKLAREFIEAGFGATLVCVDSQKLGAEFVGRAFDKSLLATLPPGIDPCGENGEFHTFVHEGPLFRGPISCRPGRVVQRGQFHFADLLPLIINEKKHEK